MLRFIAIKTNPFFFLDTIQSLAMVLSKYFHVTDRTISVIPAVLLEAKYHSFGINICISLTAYQAESLCFRKTFLKQNQTL